MEYNLVESNSTFSSLRGEYRMEKISYSFELDRLVSGEDIKKAVQRYVGVLFYEEPLVLGNGQECFFWGMHPTPNHAIALVVVDNLHEPLYPERKYKHLIIETLCPMKGRVSNYLKYMEENVEAIMLSCMKISEELSSVLAGLPSS